MRIIYGVHGYGQGHATRALAVLPELTRRHAVMVLAGGDAYETLHDRYPVLRVPTLSYGYGKNGRASTWETLRRNAPILFNWAVGSGTFLRVADEVRRFRPEVAISDAELWTHRIAARLGISRVGFDHYGILVHCRPAMRWVDRIMSYRDVFLYRLLMGKPDRIVVSSFYAAPPAREGVRMVGPLLRPEVFEMTPVQGEHILAYLNRGADLFAGRIESVLREVDAPVLVYGTGRTGRDGNLEYRPRGNREFLHSLATCRSVISTAGNQLVGEAMHFGKPLLVMPEDSVEQRVNATAIEQMNIGMQISRHAISSATVRRFLNQEERFRENLRRFARDGRVEALMEFDTFFEEILGRAVLPEPALSVA